MKKWILSGTFILMLTLMMGFVVLIIYSTGKIALPKDDSGVVGPRAISEIVRISLGGVEQTIILSSADSTLPVLLYLHGGPGCPEYALFHYFQTHLERDFTICYWEQRGCGKSASPTVPDSSMSLMKLAEDASGLARYLSRRFGQKKIICMAHSWGTLPGILSVKLHPELFSAYIGVGQIVDKELADSARLEMLRDKILRARNPSDRTKLESLGPLPWSQEENFTLFHQLRMKYFRTYPMDDFLGMTKKSLLFCEAYTPGEKWHFFENMQHAARLIMKDSRINVMAEVPELLVPVWFIQGEDDFITPSILVETYSRQLKAPSCKLILMQNASHSPMFDQPEAFRNSLKELFQEINIDGR